MCYLYFLEKLKFISRENNTCDYFWFDWLIKVFKLKLKFEF